MALSFLNDQIKGEDRSDKRYAGKRKANAEAMSALLKEAKTNGQELSMKNLMDHVKTIAGDDPVLLGQFPANKIMEMRAQATQENRQKMIEDREFDLWQNGQTMLTAGRKIIEEGVEGNLTPETISENLLKVLGPEKLKQMGGAKWIAGYRLQHTQKIAEKARTAFGTSIDPERLKAVAELYPGTESLLKPLIEENQRARLLSDNAAAIKMLGKHQDEEWYESVVKLYPKAATQLRAQLESNQRDASEARQMALKEKILADKHLIKMIATGNIDEAKNYIDLFSSDGDGRSAFSERDIENLIKTMKPLARLAQLNKWEAKEVKNTATALAQTKATIEAAKKDFGSFNEYEKGTPGAMIMNYLGGKYYIPQNNAQAIKDAVKKAVNDGVDPQTAAIEIVSKFDLNTVEQATGVIKAQVMSSIDGGRLPKPGLFLDKVFQSFIQTTRDATRKFREAIPRYEDGDLAALDATKQRYEQNLKILEADRDNIIERAQTTPDTWRNTEAIFATDGENFSLIDELNAEIKWLRDVMENTNVNADPDHLLEPRKSTVPPAHGKAVDDVIKMVSKYKNIFTDRDKVIREAIRKVSEESGVSTKDLANAYDKKTGWHAANNTSMTP